MKRLFTLVVAFSAAACSGTDGSGLLGDSGSPQDDGGVIDSSTPDASTPDDATVQDVQVQDVAQIPDAPIDTYVGPVDTRIQCGSSITCSAQSEVCCWHMDNSMKPYECVTDVKSCAKTYDVPMTCSSADNCASQGNPSYECCATGGNFGMTTACYNYDVATVVACKSSCASSDYQVGCSVKNQDCADGISTCIVSKCTVPGDTMCSF